MSKSKDNYTDWQNQQATRSNPEFQNHLQLLKEQPTPAIALQQSSVNAFNEAMDVMGIPPHQQAMLRGFMMNYGEAIKTEYQERINDMMQTHRANADYAMMLSRNPEHVIS